MSYLPNEPLQPIDVPATCIGERPPPTPHLGLVDPDCNAWGPFVVVGDDFGPVLGSRLTVQDADDDGAWVAWFDVSGIERAGHASYPIRLGEVLTWLSPEHGRVTLRPLRDSDSSWVFVDGSPPLPLLDEAKRQLALR